MQGALRPLAQQLLDRVDCYRENIPAGEPGGCVYMQLWKANGYVTGVELTDLFADRPGHGFGTKAMNFVCREADLAGLTVYLRPSSARSEVFYTRFGFTRRDSTTNWMVRHPKPDTDDGPIAHHKLEF